MKIGILLTGHAPDETKRVLGDYATMFARLLNGHGHDFEFETYKVVDNEFPASVVDCDGWLITGSKHGAYEDHAWIPPLEDFIRGVRDAKLPMIGVCFGHQIIAQALGGTVVRSDQGWIAGPQSYDFDGSEVVLNAWHQDQIITLPEGATVIASAENCPYAALLYDDQILTVQAHPEFPAEMVDGLLKFRAPGVLPESLITEVAKTLATPLNDRDFGARMAGFFKETKA